MSYPVLLILGFLSGSLIKLTDDIEDRGFASKQYAVPCGLAYGLFMGYLMLIDTDAALLFGGIDHRGADAVLHAAQRVEELGLERDCRVDAGRDALQLDQRRAADGLGDVLMDGHVRLSYFFGA